MNRLKKKVIQWGSSRVIKMSEAEVDQEFWVLSDEEFNLLQANQVVDLSEYEPENTKCEYCGLDLDIHDKSGFCPRGSEELGGKR